MIREMENRQALTNSQMRAMETPPTKQEAIYRRLKEGIMQVEFTPGQRLIIDDLADELGLSAIPIREALRQLQSEGLVDIRPHSGATVTAITPQNVEETFTILEGMEAMAARRVSLKRNEATLLELNRILRWMDRAVTEKNMSDWSGLNMDFHLALASATNMPWLREITERALHNWDRIRRYYFPEGVPHRIQEAQKEHYALLEAIKNQNAEQAEKIIREHNRHALDHYTKLVGKL